MGNVSALVIKRRSDYYVAGLLLYGQMSLQVHATILDLREPGLSIHT